MYRSTFSALIGVEYSASPPGRLTPVTHQIGPRAVLDDMDVCKFLTLSGFALRPLGRPTRSQSLCTGVIALHVFHYCLHVPHESPDDGLSESKHFVSRIKGFSFCDGKPSIFNY
jgi:hypothetical protein